MTRERYERIEAWFGVHPVLLRALVGLNCWLPRLVYGVYPLVVLYLAIHKDERIFRVLLVPAAAFATVTVLRRVRDTPRPYEELDFTPLIPRAKKGQSFPSRHTASASVIAAACWSVWPPLGAALAAVALLIAVVRPLGGIHYIRDTVAGLLLGLAFGLVGFVIV